MKCVTFASVIIIWTIMSITSTIASNFMHCNILNNSLELPRYKHQNIRQHFISLLELSKTCKKRTVSIHRYPHLYNAIKKAIDDSSAFDEVMDAHYDSLMHIAMSALLPSLVLPPRPLSKEKRAEYVRQAFFFFDILQDDEHGKFRCFHYEHMLDHGEIKKKRRKKRKNEGHQPKKTAKLDTNTSIFADKNDDHLFETLNQQYFDSKTGISTCLAHNVDMILTLFGDATASEYIKLIYPGAELYKIPNNHSTCSNSKTVIVDNQRVWKGMYLYSGDIVCTLTDHHSDTQEGNKTNESKEKVLTPTRRPLIYMDTRMSLLVYIATDLVRHKDPLYVSVIIPDKCACKRRPGNPEEFFWTTQDHFFNSLWLYGLWLRNGHQLENFWDSVPEMINETECLDLEHQSQLQQDLEFDFTKDYEKRRIRTNYILKPFLKSGKIFLLSPFYQNPSFSLIIMTPKFRLETIYWSAFYRHVSKKTSLFSLRVRDGKNGSLVDLGAPANGIFCPISDQHLLTLINDKIQPVINVPLGYFISFTAPKANLKNKKFLREKNENKNAFFRQLDSHIMSHFSHMAPILVSSIAFHMLIEIIQLKKRFFMQNAYQDDELIDEFKDLLKLYSKPILKSFALLGEDQTETQNQSYFDQHQELFQFSSNDFAPLIIGGHQLSKGDVVLIKYQIDDIKNASRVIKWTREEEFMCFQDFFQKKSCLYLLRADPEIEAVTGDETMFELQSYI